MALAVWHLIVHLLGVDYGLPYGHWGWYNFWSGVAGSFLVGVAVYGGTHFAHGTCHAHPWCFRRGRFEAAGGLFKVCHKHHPELKGRKPTPLLVSAMHHSYLAARGGSR